MNIEHRTSNGRFYTMDSKSSVARAVAIKDGRFLAVGEEATVGDLAGPGTRQLDLIRLSPCIPW